MDGEKEEEEEEEEEVRLVEERVAEMVAFTKPKVPIRRTGWFLCPISSSAHEPLGAPFVPSRHKTISPDAVEEAKVVFSGWKFPLRNWEEWVEKLQPIYADSWKQVGIFDAIVASTYAIHRDPSSILGVIGFWCGETNTFLFPWAEATLTLEDVMVLGGLPVLGESVRRPLEAELVGMEQKMKDERRKFNRSSQKKAHHAAWTRHYMDRDGDELEHIAFLSLWLARFVFPHIRDTLTEQVLPIAVRLARGVRVALAPAVLADLYRDLRAVKDYLLGDKDHQESSCVVCAPFRILQMWLWERFVALRPERHHAVGDDEPRAARWQNMGLKRRRSSRKLVFESASEFQWRPYTIRLGNRCRASFYRKTGEWVRGDAARDEGLRSLAQCLRACELVGLDSIEQYLPHRVAMQFRLDQDVPCAVPRANSTWEAAWETYDIARKDVVFYVPPRIRKSDVTVLYSQWWKQDMLGGCNDSVGSVIARDAPSKNVEDSQRKNVGKGKTRKAQSQTSSKKRPLQDLYNSTLSGWPTSDSGHIGKKYEGVNSQKASPAIAEIRKPLISTRKQERHKNVMQSVRHEEEERAEQSVDAPGQIKVEKRTRMGEDCTSDSLDVKGKGIVEDVKKTDAGGCANTSDVLDTEEKRVAEVVLKADNGQDTNVYDPLDTKDMGIVKDVKRRDPGESANAYDPSDIEDKEIVEEVKREDAGESSCSYGPSDIKDKGILESIEKTNDRESTDDLIAIDDSELTSAKQVKFKTTRRLDRGLEKAREEMQIKKLKEEIALLQAKLLEAETQAE